MNWPRSFTTKTRQKHDGLILTFVTNEREINEVLYLKFSTVEVRYKMWWADRSS